MAIRYYTEEAYNQIEQTIKTIQDTDLHPVVDFFRDLLSRIALHLKIYTVDNYQDDIQTWYNIVLDSHNTTMANVDSIFSAVESTDFEYRSLVGDAYSSISSFRNAVNCLRDVISGKTSLADGKAAADRYISAGQNALRSSYDAMLTKMEVRILYDASKELISDAISLGAGYAKLIGAKGDPIAIASACKKIGDAAFSSLGDLMAICSFIDVIKVGFEGAATGMSYDSYLDYRFNSLTVMQKLKDNNSISDTLGHFAEGMEEMLADCPKDSPYSSLAKAVKNSAKIYHGVDIASDAYDLVSGLKDSVDTFYDWRYGKNYSLEEYIKASEKKNLGEIFDCVITKKGPVITVKVPAKETISKIVSAQTGIPLTDWNDPTKGPGNKYKLISTVWSYVQKGIPNADGLLNSGELSDVAIDKFREIKNIKNLIEDVGDFVEGTPEETEPKNSSCMVYDRSKHIWTKSESQATDNKGGGIHWGHASISQATIQKPFMNAAARTQN